MGKFFKVLLSAVLSLVLLAGIVIFPAPRNVSAITDHYMAVTPRKIGAGATYKFNFTIERKLEVHDWIKLWWPVEVTFPKLPDPIAERAAYDAERKRIIESMSIGLSPCSSCQGLPIITDTPTEKSIQFNSHIGLDPAIEGYKHITITVPDVVGIKNPEKPGDYTFRIATKVEPTPVPSAPFSFVESRLGHPEGIPVVEVTPPSFRSPASYKITFNVGEGGWLKQGEGLIRLRFPESTSFTRNVIAENAILVNGSPLTVKVSPRGTNLIFNTPLEISDAGKVEVMITERAGIVNPSRPGVYTIEVSTQPGDPEWVPSEPYEIVKGGAMLKVNPSNVNKVAEYSFAFILDEKEALKKADRLLVLFSEGTEMPTNITASTVTINNVPAVNVTVNGNEATVYSGVDLSAGDTCEVRFDLEANIVNPRNAGEIKLGYKFHNAPEYLYTLPVLLTESKLEAGEVSVEPRNASSYGQWTIAIRLGDNGALTSNDFIGIEFPDNTIIPNLVPANMVLLNGEEAEKVIVSGYELHIYPTSSIEGGKNIEIIIDRSSKIENPSEPKTDYYLTIYTSKEIEKTKTDIFNINNPLPRTTVDIIGGQKGRNDWFIEPPLVGFNCTSSTAEIFVFFDDNEDQTITYLGTPQAMELGQYVSKISYYARDVFGTEEVQSFEIKVDTVGPEMEVIHPSESRTLTRDPNTRISGRTTLIKTVRYGIDVSEYDKYAYINDEQVPVSDEDGSFGKDVVLNEGENKFVVRTEDEAGNSVSREYVILLDTIAPEVEIISPSESSVITTTRTTVTGKTEANALLTINGEVVFVESDGSFEHDIRLSKIGKNKLEIEAVDAAGNASEMTVEFWFGYTLVLQIGNKIGKTNDVEKTMDVPPFISQGRTLVPFRYVGEQLNANIDFTQNPTTRLVEDVIYELGSTRIVLTIGKTEAMVNGNKVKMDVPAQIVSGRTVVPIRFVTEALGCKVDWEGKEQIITITYPAI